MCKIKFWTKLDTAVRLLWSRKERHIQILRFGDETLFPGVL